VRVQARLELQTGQLEGPWLQDGRASERSGASSMEKHPLPPGSLYVTDTGYVTLQRMRAQSETERYWLAPANLRYQVVDQKGSSGNSQPWSRPGPNKASRWWMRRCSLESASGFPAA
jgi:hypothetical protein